MKSFKVLNKNQIMLSEGIDRMGISRIQVIRTGTFLHPDAPNGKFTVTKEMLDKFVSNYELDVRRQMILMDYRHDVDGPSAGEFKNIEVVGVEEQPGQYVLEAEIDWTERAEEEILKKEWRYISADISLDYQDNESGTKHGPVLLGAALVNRPHIKSMRQVFAEQDQPTNNGGRKVTPEEMLKRIEELTAKVVQLEAMVKSGSSEMESKEAELAETKECLQNAEKTLSEKETELNTLKDETIKTKKEMKFSELMGSGKVLPAQKESFMKMDLTLAEEFFGASTVKINLNEQGHGTEPKQESDSNESATDKLISLAEKRASEKSLAFHVALGEVRAENPELTTEADKE